MLLCMYFIWLTGYKLFQNIFTNKSCVTSAADYQEFIIVTYYGLLALCTYLKLNNISNTYSVADLGGGLGGL